jgi:hypothetical protein
VNEFEWIARLPPSLLKHLETHNCPGQETPPKRIKKDKRKIKKVFFKVSKLQDDDQFLDNKDSRS